MIDRIETFRRVMVVTPHPDDEVLAAGGTMARLAAAGSDVFVAIVTRGYPPLFEEAEVAKIVEESHHAHTVLGVRETFFLGQPSAQLPSVPHSTLNAEIGGLVNKVEPDLLLVPFVGDMHMDHRLVFISTLVAARPHSPQYPGTVLCYETLSETNWNAPYITPNFVPNVFVDIGATLERKIEAMRCYGSQLRAPPHERSLASVRALATFRGATVHRAAAEAFVLVRHVV